MNTKATTVIDYIVQRIADEGVEHCFGVPGDYAFPVGDAVDRNPNIKWIGCSNELNASYAADGYARALGAWPCCRRLMQWVSYLQSTESWARKRSAHSCFHVVGMPSYQNQQLRKNDASHSRRRNF